MTVIQSCMRTSQTSRDYQMLFKSTWISSLPGWEEIAEIFPSHDLVRYNIKRSLKKVYWKLVTEESKVIKERDINPRRHSTFLVWVSLSSVEWADFRHTGWEREGIQEWLSVCQIPEDWPALCSRTGKREAHWCYCPLRETQLTLTANALDLGSQGLRICSPCFPVTKGYKFLSQSL